MNTERLNSNNGMRKVHTDGAYDFYIGVHTGKGGYRSSFYNIVPSGSPAPSAGYFNMKAIENIKGVLFPDRYQRMVKIP